MLRAWSACLLAVAGLGVRTNAQQDGITRYDLDQGLPQSLVNHVLQDADGFIWFGTGDGLARSDGARIVVYKHDPQDSTSISHNAIWGLAEAGPHHLWVGTRTGLDRLDRRTGRFEHMRVGERNGKNGCWQPVATSTDRTLFYSPLTRELLHVEGSKFSRTPTHHRDCYCTRLSADGRQFVSIAHPDTLITLDLTSGAETVQRIPLDAGDRVVDMTPMGGRWLILTQRTGWILEENGTRSELPEPLRSMVNDVQAIKHVQRDAQGGLWLGLSGSGILQLSPDLRIERFHPLEPNDARSMNMTVIAFDRQGNTWIGTDGRGVLKIAPQRIKFSRVGPGMRLPWEPPNWFVRAFAQWDEHRVLISFHQGGLALFDERTGTLTPHRVHGRAPDATYVRMGNDADGLIWLKDEGGLLVLDPAGDAGGLTLPNSADVTFLRDGQDGVLLVDNDHVIPVRMDGGRPVFGPTRRHPALDSLKGAYERMAIDPLGQWWSSGPELAVHVWNSAGPVPIAGARPAVGMRMMNLIPTGEGQAWMTTNEGLLRWRLSPPEILDHFTIHDGLPDQFTYGAVQDTDGRWWVSTNNGLVRFDPATERFRSYTTVHGLQSREFNAGAFLRSRSGRIYFGGVNGFNHFMSGSVTDDPDLAQVEIVGVYDRSGALPLAKGATVQLPFPRNELRVELAVLEFTGPEDDRVKWRLAGYDTSWRINRPTEPIELSNLPAGEFMLEAIGINGDGVEGGKEVLLRIVVRRPFWTNPWFIALAAGTVIGSAAGLWVHASRRRMRRKLAAQERELRELRLRTRLAKDIHDDVGSGLARVAALSRSARRETDAAARFDKVADISSELLDNLRDVVWMNDPRHDTLDAVLVRIREHAQDLFEDSGTAVRALFPDPLPERTVDGSFRRNIYLIAKEALHNARKYSGAGTITLRWMEADGTYTFEVQDDGAGVQVGAPQGGGHGSENMRQRATEIGAHYARTSDPGHGTTVRVHGRTSQHAQ